MDSVGFLEAVADLNRHNYFYGNEVLYKMAADSDIQKPEQLAGIMWIIGRSYAASPQRRAYGTKKENNWPVRSDNDGRDQFFSFIAKEITGNDLRFLDALKEPVRYVGADAEPDLLAKGIYGVLQFNLLLSEAIGHFDYAPPEEHCNGHISFCSKLLHFYYPHAVFIIDSYAQAGATNLFNRSGMGYICSPSDPDTYDVLKMQTDCSHHFSESVYALFPKKQTDALVKCLMEHRQLAELTEAYSKRGQDAKPYIIHCVRSYILGCLLEGKVAPVAQVAEGQVRSMPRLIDTVFLNVKGKLTRDGAKRYLKLMDDYGHRCRQYKEMEAYRDMLKAIAGKP